MSDIIPPFKSQRTFVTLTEFQPTSLKSILFKTPNVKQNTKKYLEKEVLHPLRPYRNEGVSKAKVISWVDKFIGLYQKKILPLRSVLLQSGNEGVYEDVVEEEMRQVYLEMQKLVENFVLDQCSKDVIPKIDRMRDLFEIIVELKCPKSENVRYEQVFGSFFGKFQRILERENPEKKDRFVPVQRDRKIKTKRKRLVKAIPLDDKLLLL